LVVVFGLVTRVTILFVTILDPSLRGATPTDD
jgi:hypothetical protein